jgi:hypothetical protein
VRILEIVKKSLYVCAVAVSSVRNRPHRMIGLAFGVIRRREVEGIAALQLVAATNGRRPGRDTFQLWLSLWVNQTAGSEERLDVVLDICVQLGGCDGRATACSIRVFVVLWWRRGEVCRESDRARV